MNKEIARAWHISRFRNVIEQLRDFLQRTDPNEYGMRRYENMNYISKVSMMLLLENEDLIAEVQALKKENSRLNKFITEKL
jgi:hypothetical protein